MNTFHLRNFLLLAKKRHFTRVAKEVNIVQPALSRQIQQLESELEVKLFKRNKRKVELTAAGVYFAQEISEILSRLDRIHYRLKQIEGGEDLEVRIGFTHSVMQTILPEVIQKIRKSKSRAQTILKEINNKKQFVALQNRELDIGFTTNPIIPTGLKGKRLSSSNFVLLLPLDHPVSEDNFTDLSVFANEEFIFPPVEDGSNYLRILKSICYDAGFTPKITHITSSASASFKLVETGMGICIEPKFSVFKQELPVKIIELKNIPQKAELTMIWNEDFGNEYPDLLQELKNAKSYKTLNVTS